MSRNLIHDRLRNAVVLTSVGKIEVDKDGKVNINGLDNKKINKLLTIPHFSEEGKQKEANVNNVTEDNTDEEKKDESKSNKKVNLYTMKLADLKSYAEEKGIKLSATKRNEIIDEIKKAEEK